MNESNGSAKGRLGDDLAAVWGVLLRPVETFAALRTRHPVLVPWLVGSALSVGLTLLTVSVSQRAAAHLLAGMDSPETAEQVRAALQRMKVWSVGAAPIGLLARWSLTALVLWASAVLASGAATYRCVLSIVAYSALPGMFGKGVDLAVTWFEGPEFTPDLVPTLSSATSLGALLPAVQGPWAAAFLDHLTLFGVWGAVLWTVGVRVKLGLGWTRSLAAVLPVWTLLLVLAAAADVVGRSFGAGAAGLS